MDTVLVTGSAGGVGAWTVDALADAGREVVAVDRDAPPSDDRRDDVEYKGADLTDYGETRQVFELLSIFIAFAVDRSSFQWRFTNVHPIALEHGVAFLIGIVHYPFTRICSDIDEVNERRHFDSTRIRKVGLYREGSDRDPLGIL
nr:NAD-dependent epimerase/dehydratase family protein [Halorubrum sp. Atlit-26R]